MRENTIFKIESTSYTAADAKAMEREIRLISRFHSLNLIRGLVSICLFIYESLSSFYGYHNVSCLQILLVYNLMPWVLELFLSPYVKKKPAVLPYLRKKYHYTSLRYTTNTISFLMACFLLLLWQGHQGMDTPPFPWFHFVPATLAAGAVLLRFFAPVLVAGHIRRRLSFGRI